MIRPARQADAPCICALWNEVIDSSTITFTTVRKTLLQIENLISEAPVFVADGDGFALLGPFRAGPGYARVREHSIYLRPEAQGKGIGRALMQVVEAAARAEGVDVLIGGVSGSNPGAITFHERLGFEVVARMPAIGEKWGARHDLVLLQKNLTD